MRFDLVMGDIALVVIVLVVVVVVVVVVVLIVVTAAKAPLPGRASLGLVCLAHASSVHCILDALCLSLGTHRHRLSVEDNAQLGGLRGAEVALQTLGKANGGGVER